MFVHKNVFGPIRLIQSGGFEGGLMQAGSMQQLLDVANTPVFILFKTMESNTVKNNKFIT